MGPRLRLLLDTHALFWWVNDSSNLSQNAREAIGDRSNEISVSVVSAFEMATKHNLGKWPEVAVLIDSFAASLDAEGFQLIALDVAEALRGGGLPLVHSDPFDRLIIAQALGRTLTLVSNEVVFDAYGVTRLW